MLVSDSMRGDSGQGYMICRGDKSVVCDRSPSDRKLGSSSFLSFQQESCPLNCALPMPGTADGDVVSRCQVLGRAGSVHHGQTSRCCMVCLILGCDRSTPAKDDRRI